MLEPVARVSPLARCSRGIISRLPERLWISSGTLFVETEERCLRISEAVRESIKLSWELHLLIGEKLLRGDVGFVSDGPMPWENG